MSREVVYRKDHQHRCPHCNVQIGISMHTKDGSLGNMEPAVEPQDDDISVCSACATFLHFRMVRGELTLCRMTHETKLDTMQNDPEAWVHLQQARTEVLAKLNKQ